MYMWPIALGCYGHLTCTVHIHVTINLLELFFAYLIEGMSLYCFFKCMHTSLGHFILIICILYKDTINVYYFASTC